MSEWKDVASILEFKPGTRVLVKTGHFDAIVFNLDGVFYAIEDACTHDGESFADGDLDGKEIICPRHGAQFDIITGKVTVAPALEDIQIFPTRVKDGVVQIKI